MNNIECIEGDFELFCQELEYAYDNVPFYQAHLDNAGVSPQDITCEADIKNIPSTQKSDYRRNFTKVVAEGYSLKDEAMVRSQSSGSEGERLMTFELGMLLIGRAMDCCAANEAVEAAFTLNPRKIVRYAAPNCSDVECANPNSTMADRLLSDGTLVLPLYHDLLTTNDVLINRALDEICEQQPDLYYVDPTHFAFLLNEAKKRGRTLPNAPIVATYTGMTPLNRKQILDAFESFGHEDVTLAQLVSSSEMGWLAMECEHGHLHLNTDVYYMEIVKDGRDAKSGETGELYITSLDNGAVPHVRYKTGDAFKVIGDECDCGLHTPVVEMQGRLSSFLVKDGKAAISPAEVGQTIGAPDWLNMYQLEQLEAQRYVLRLIANEQYQANDENALVDALLNLVGPEADIKVEKVGYIATERSGKFQCVKTALTASGL